MFANGRHWREAGRQEKEIGFIFCLQLGAASLKKQTKKRVPNSREHQRSSTICTAPPGELNTWAYLQNRSRVIDGESRLNGYQGIGSKR